MSHRGEIENLLNRWCWAMDERDAGALEQIYSAEARLTTELPQREATTIDGRDAILASLRETWARVPATGVKHVFTTSDIGPETDGEVRLRSYFVAYRLVGMADLNANLRAAYSIVHEPPSTLRGLGLPAEPGT